MIFYRIRHLIVTGAVNRGIVVSITVVMSLAQVKAAFASPHLDANGWMVFPASADTRTIYVSSSMGNNGNSGLSPETAVATIAAGKARLRNGYPDQLLLKAGDIFLNQSFGYLGVSGRSPTAPIIIGRYGAGADPVVQTTPKTNWGVGIGSLPGRGGNFIVVQGIEFYAYTRDPKNPGYRGPNSEELGANFLNPDTWVLLTGNKFSFYSTDIVFNNSEANISSSVVALYRNVVTNAWSATSHSQGLYVSGIGNLVIEQNVFDHNGWNASIPGAEATVFNRNVYIQFNNGLVTFTGNISANSSSEGAQFRAGGIISDNLFVANSAGFSLGESVGTSPPSVPPTVNSAVAVDNVVVSSNDIQSSSGPLPRSNGIQIFNASGAGVRVTKNIIAHAAGSLINQSGIYLNNDVSGIQATNNVIYGVANPIVDSGTNNTTSPNAINLTGYRNPEVSVESYNASLGGSPSLSTFLTGACKQGPDSWRPQYTANAVNRYIRAGFSK